LDLIKHEASGAEHAQHIWPQFEISNCRNYFQASNSKPLDPDELDRQLWMKFFAASRRVVRLYFGGYGQL
jgi:hypothetical protein